MKSNATIIACKSLLILIAGCRMHRGVSGPSGIAELASTTTILIHTPDNTIEVNDTKTIARLTNVFGNADWQPYRHTLPANITEKSMVFVAGGTEIQRFGYSGPIWALNSYVENRQADLCDTDREWIDSLFSQIPDPRIAKDEPHQQ